jgi:hypothetical protein
MIRETQENFPPGDELGAAGDVANLDTPDEEVQIEKYDDFLHAALGAANRSHLRLDAETSESEGVALEKYDEFARVALDGARRAEDVR